MSTTDVYALLGGGMNQDDIDKVIRISKSQSAQTQMMSLAVRQTKDPQFAAMRTMATPSPETATWANLFGDVSFCKCDHCRSVYSPAAYFVDLMSLLDQGAIGAVTNPLEVLLARRPDLELLQLSCANTNTVMPYIDLVNEALESFVIHQLITPLSDITMGDTGEATAAELAAAPQHIDHSAYDVLAAASFPLSMPFVRPLEVARTYLDHMGAPRLQLLRALKGANGVTQRIYRR